MPRPIITLLTDFGSADAYVGVMMGVILSINPNATLVDLSHEVRPQAIAQAAFLLGTSYRYFPRSTVHVVVVDPGVGTERRAILLRTPHGRFVAPDNGALSYVLRDGLAGAAPHQVGELIALPEGFHAYVLDEPAFWRQPVSRTFHGRDIFAPVAAHLSLHTTPEALGHETREVVWLSLVTPRWQDDMLEGEVLHIDRFGNLVTSVPAALLSDANVVVEVKGKRIVGMSPSYAAGAQLLALVGSHGYLEVAVRDGSAARILSVEVGERVLVRRA